MGMQTELADLGLISNKHILKYRCASPAQRLALLRGLIDTDGHVASDGRLSSALRMKSWRGTLCS